MVYTRPNGSQLVMLYPFLVPTETHLYLQSAQLISLWLRAYVKSWLKLANSMFELDLIMVATSQASQAREARACAPLGLRCFGAADPVGRFRQTWINVHRRGQVGLRLP